LYACHFSFGVCCVFLYNTATSLSISQNCSYIQNPGFPAAYTGQSSVTYTINKCDSCKWIALCFEVDTNTHFVH
jgi:hypothetical protein